MLFARGLTATLLAVAVAAERVYLPGASGHYQVGKTQHVFNHTTRHDPVAPNANHTGTFMVVSIYYPSEYSPKPNETLQYLDPTLAQLLEEGWDLPTGQLEKLWTPHMFQAPTINGTAGQNKFPTILLSPGAGVPCVLYTLLSSDIASQGYTVLCIDHPGEPPYLQIPYGGGGVYGLPINETLPSAFYKKMYEYRVSDLDALLTLYPPLVDEFGAPFNKSTFLAVGHSFGGPSLAGAMASNDCILGGINLDGSFLRANITDIDRPFLLMSSDGHSSETDKSWAAFEHAQSGPWDELEVRGSSHLDYSDLPVVLQLLGLEGRKDLIGPIKPSRMRIIQTAFVSAFFRHVLGWPEDVLEKPLPNKEWPEVIRTAQSKGTANSRVMVS